MKTLKDRQKDILGWVVREYTKTSKPVASKEIASEFHLTISPATIRNEMLELDRLGYLNQPHVSAGRVPTDRGYRFFIDYLLEEIPLVARNKNKLRDIFAEEDEDEFAEELADFASAHTSNLTLCGLGRNVHKKGFSEILEEPEFGKHEMTVSLGRLLDRLDKEAERFMEKFDDEAVFVGEENPFKEGREMSMMATSWCHPEGFRGFLVFVGPKRMNYEKNKSFIKYLKEFSHE